MTPRQDVTPDYRPDYLVTTAKKSKLASGSHFSERKSTAPHHVTRPVVTPVVSKNGRFPLLLSPLTTDYSLDHQKEKERKKEPLKEYARARGSRSQLARFQTPTPQESA